MDLTLKRTNKNTGAIIGFLTVNKVFECWTLEDPQDFIPLGTYPVEITYSPHFKEDLPLLDGVPNRTAIRIHPGNTKDDTEGCILVGQAHTDSMVLQSRLAFSHLFVQIRQALDNGESVSITVC